MLFSFFVFTPVIGLPAGGAASKATGADRIAGISANKSFTTARPLSFARSLDIQVLPAVTRPSSDPP